MTFDIDTYQYNTRSTAVYPNNTEGDAINYTLIGLANEAGEALGKWKKVLRDNDGELTSETRVDLAKELGDVLWYLVRATDDLGYNVSDIAMANQHKLEDRLARGVIGGSGDNR